MKKKTIFVNSSLMADEFRCLRPHCQLAHRFTDLDSFRRHDRACQLAGQLTSSDSAYGTEAEGVWGGLAGPERGRDKMEMGVSWGGGGMAAENELKSMLNNGPDALRAPTMVACPHAGCAVRGQRIIYHRLWCQFQPIYRRRRSAVVVKGFLNRGLITAKGGGTNFTIFNQSFRHSLGLSFEVKDRGGKIRFRCAGEGGKAQNFKYLMSIKLPNFRYRMVGRTAEVKPHRLPLPVRMADEKLLRYTITLYDNNVINNDNINNTNNMV